VLDLSQVEHAPVKVKLPDGVLYDMAAPGSLGALPLQRLMARWRRAQAIMDMAEPTDDELEEMLELVLDVGQVVLPDAPREQLGRVGLDGQRRMIEAFFGASPAAAGRREAKPARKAGTRKTSARR